jgi:hypothetical protein
LTLALRGRLAPGRGLCPMTLPTRRDRARRTVPTRQLARLIRFRAEARVRPITFGTTQRRRVGKIRRAFSKTVKRGRVISEKPKPGMVLPKRGKVNLVVSRGRKR